MRCRVCSAVSLTSVIHPVLHCTFSNDFPRYTCQTSHGCGSMHYYRFDTCLYFMLYPTFTHSAYCFLAHLGPTPIEMSLLLTASPLALFARIHHEVLSTHLFYSFSNNSLPLSNSTTSSASSTPPNTAAFLYANPLTSLSLNNFVVFPYF